jgi:hypothetical protein
MTQRILFLVVLSWVIFNQGCFARIRACDPMVLATCEP